MGLELTLINLYKQLGIRGGRLINDYFLNFEDNTLYFKEEPVNDDILRLKGVQLLMNDVLNLIRLYGNNNPLNKEFY